MFEFNKFANGSNEDGIVFRLRAVYDTKTIGRYRNDLLEEETPLSGVILTLEGSGAIELKDKTRYLIPKGHLIFAHLPDVKALLSEDEEWHFHCYWFVKSELELPVYSVLPYQSGDGCSFITQILTYLSEENAYGAPLANNLFTAKVLSFLTSQARLAPDQQGERKFLSILNYVKASIYTNESLESIAARFGYCEKQLRNLFRKYMGVAPKQYLIQAKVEKACQLLTLSSYSVNEISDALKFSSPFHFTNTFKKVKGMSPSAYREKMSHSAVA